MRIPLLGGSYNARSIIANAQRCVNYFPEANPKDSPVAITHYQRPGLRPLVSGEAAPVRCLYRASNGNGYCVIGQSVYAISPAWVLTLLGKLVSPATTPVSMIDNGASVSGGGTIFLADNSPLGYKINLGTNAFSQVIDPNGLFNGATKVDFIDTYMLWNILGTNEFGSTLSNQLLFDGLYIAGKINYPDPLVTIAVCRREIFLLGQLKSEIWFDAGNTGFPFAELPGASFEHGCVAPFSCAQSDTSVFWLGLDLQGQGVVFRGRAYQCVRISNHALEYQIRKMAAAGTITDAVGYTYQQDGHVFYVLSFPSGNQTWVFDDSIPGEIWHQRAWTDANGNLNRDRSNVAANMYGTNAVGDWQNGTIYALDPTVYTDTVGGLAGPISYIRSFPHITTAEMSFGTPGRLIPTSADGRQMKFTNFTADIEAGTADGLQPGPAGNPSSSEIGLRFSTDRGRTWGQTVLQSAGASGQYLTQPKWGTIGAARDMVFEISHSINGPCALNGAWVDAIVMNN